MPTRTTAGHPQDATNQGRAQPRTLRAPHGTTLSCKGWQQEAALRMLMNNLNPDVAERPKEFSIHGCRGPSGPPREFA